MRRPYPRPRPPYSLAPSHVAGRPQGPRSLPSHVDFGPSTCRNTSPHSAPRRSACTVVASAAPRVAAQCLSRPSTPLVRATALEERSRTSRASPRRAAPSRPRRHQRCPRSPSTTHLAPALPAAELLLEGHLHRTGVAIPKSPWSRQTAARDRHALSPPSSSPAGALRSLGGSRSTDRSNRSPCGRHRDAHPLACRSHSNVDLDPWSWR